MIYWLKVRDRGNLDFVLRNLNAWLGAFSNKDDQIIIYNKDLNLPNYYKYRVINKQDLLRDRDCIELQKIVNSSVIGEKWKPIAFALCAPYFFIKEDVTILNQDADDIILFGNAEKYIKQVGEFLEKNNLPTLSYDYIYSHNPFYTNNFIPNHWTFGTNVSKRKLMNELVKKAIYSSKELVKPLKIARAQDINIDILVSLFLEKTNNPYNAFITKEGFSHESNDFFYSRYRDDLGRIEMVVQGNPLLVNKHPKTIIL